jgi:hypothetical protein
MLQRASSCFSTYSPLLGRLDSVGCLKVLEIHTAVEGRPILSCPHVSEEGADSTTLLRLLALRPRLVRHDRSAPIGKVPAKPEGGPLDISLEAVRRPSLTVRRERYETTKLVPTPVRRRTFDAAPRPSREACTRWALEQAEARRWVHTILDLRDSPRPFAASRRDILLRCDFKSLIDYIVDFRDSSQIFSESAPETASIGGPNVGKATKARNGHVQPAARAPLRRAED